MDFLNLHTVDYVLVGTLLVLFLAQLYWYSRYMAAPARRIRKDRKLQMTTALPIDRNGKYLKNGHLLIEHNGRTFTAQGVEVR